MLPLKERLSTYRCVSDEIEGTNDKNITVRQFAIARRIGNTTIYINVIVVVISTNVLDAIESGLLSQAEKLAQYIYFFMCKVCDEITLIQFHIHFPLG